MTTISRTSLSTTLAVLLAGAVATACGAGGGGAPSDASTDDFCAAQSSLFTDLDLDLDDPASALPTEEDMADSMHTWADALEEVGTPESISDEARQGFEETVEAARRVSAEDLSSPDLDALDTDLSEEAQARVESFTTYVSDTCGSLVGEVPELPEITELPEPTG